jgi:hypothetical protein
MDDDPFVRAMIQKQRERIPYHRACIRNDKRRLRNATIMCWFLRWPARLQVPFMREWFQQWDEARSHAQYELEESVQCLWKAENRVAPIVVGAPSDAADYDGWLAPEDRFGN